MTFFPTSLESNGGMLPQIGHDRFLTHPINALFLSYPLTVYRPSPKY